MLLTLPLLLGPAEHVWTVLPPALQLGLIERLTNIMPQGLDKFFFANSGSEAVDNAVKIARAHTGRQNIIAFEVRPC